MPFVVHFPLPSSVLSVQYSVASSKRVLSVPDCQLAVPFLLRSSLLDVECSVAFPRRVSSVVRSRSADCSRHVCGAVALRAFSSVFAVNAYTQYYARGPGPDAFMGSPSMRELP